MPERFPLAPMSSQVRLITIAFFIVGIFLSGLGYFLSTGIPPFVPILLLIIALGTWLFLRPSFFSIDEEFLAVHFPLRTLRYGHGDLRKLGRIQGEDLKGTTRFGVGGLFGSFGIFNSPKLGVLHGYFTNREDLVLIEITGKRSLLISPSDSAAFIKTLEAAKAKYPGPEPLGL